MIEDFTLTYENGHLKVQAEAGPVPNQEGRFECERWGKKTLITELISGIGMV